MDKMIVSWQTLVDLRTGERMIEKGIVDESVGILPIKSILKRDSACPFRECFGRRKKRVKINCEYEQTDV